MASVISAQTSGAGGISMTGDASGILNLNSNGTNVVAVTSAGVAVTGTLAATGAITGSSTVAGSTGILYPLTSGTAVASTSGTSIDFTSIPSWVKRITVMFTGVSTNGSGIRLQLGSGSAQTTGYNSIYFVTDVSTASNSTNSTSGFELSSFAASGTLYGQIVFCLLGSNIWVGLGGYTNPVANRTLGISGGVTLSGVLDRVRITTINGTDVFDAGSVNILYE
jgi:hypothetical protein